MGYRVVQWGTGNVGGFALRAILGHPELELVGVKVHADAKAGLDAGSLCGQPPVGVVATTSAEEVLNLDADCVCYTASADRRPFEAVDDMCRALTSGKNVVSSSVVGLVHPKTLHAQITAQLEDACREGGTSFFTSGVDPGFANDILPLVLVGCSLEWSRVKVLEIVNYASYDQPDVLFDIMGFGKPMDHTPMLLMPGALGFGWGGTIRLLAEGLGVELDEIKEVWERRAAERPIAIGPHTVAPGTMGALRFEVQGIVGGQPALVVEHVTRLDDDLAPDWPSGNGSYRVQIDGVPRMRLEFEFEDEQGDHAVGGVILTAGRIVNAIPAVCRAAAGPLSALDLPLVSARGLFAPG